MRIIFFAGKGGVGKTSVASASGIRAAELGYKTIIMSLDSAHSLGDIFDLDRELMDKNRGLPVKVGKRLWIQELDVQEEIQKNWGEVHKYFSLLLNTTGFDEVLAEELAILPGMEEVSSLLHINRYYQRGQYQVIILDCAPTGESLRFISIPTALEWYIKKIFNLERTLAKLARPIARHITDIPLPQDEYFEALEKLFKRLQGVDKILTDPGVTTVRLVTNPEKIVLKETQRAFMYFSLYHMCIDGIILNRILPEHISEAFFDDWKVYQKRYARIAEECFSPVPIIPVDLFPGEIVGPERLHKLAQTLYDSRDPTEIFFKEPPYRFYKEEDRYVLELNLPFLTKKDVKLNKVGEELLIRVGGFKRNLILPRQVVGSARIRAKLDGNCLRIFFEEEEYAEKSDQ
nr:ArsA family ATPase [Desulfobacterales bacterium]